MTPVDPAAVSDVPFVSEEKLPGLFRRGIAGCRARNAQQVGQVLIELIGALNFDYEEAATRLFEVYDDCLGRVARRQFEVPQRILENMHGAFATAPAIAPARALGRHGDA